MRSRKTLEKREAEAKEFFEDGHGVWFSEIRQHLPCQPRSWPRPLRFVSSPRVLEAYRMLVGGQYCPLCNRPWWQGGGDELHHIVGGVARSDELCNLILICAECHKIVQHATKWMPFVWAAKWRQERYLTDWVRLVRLLGKWPGFDDLEGVDAPLSQYYT